MIIDEILNKIQLNLYRINLDKLGNLVQDFRNKYTLPRRRRIEEGL